MTNRVKILKEKFSQSLGLPFQNLLPQSEIQKVLDELKIKYRQRLFDPFVTLWAFLSQVLEPDKSCHNVTSRVISYLVGEKVELPSTNSSAYCGGRARLPEEFLQKLFGKVAQGLEDKAPVEYLWCGRHVKVIDGSSVSMPDTPENQEVYPRAQKPKAWMWVPNCQDWCDI